MFWDPSGMKVLIRERAPGFYLGVAESVVLLDSRRHRLRLTWKASNNFYLLFIEAGVGAMNVEVRRQLLGVKPLLQALESELRSKAWEQVFLSSGTSHQPHSHRLFRSSRGQNTGQTVCGGSGPVAEWPEKNAKLSEYMAGLAQGYKP